MPKVPEAKGENLISTRVPGVKVPSGLGSGSGVGRRTEAQALGNAFGKIAKTIQQMESNDKEIDDNLLISEKLKKYIVGNDAIKTEMRGQRNNKGQIENKNKMPWDQAVHENRTILKVDLENEVEDLGVRKRLQVRMNALDPRMIIDTKTEHIKHRAKGHADELQNNINQWGSAIVTAAPDDDKADPNMHRLGKLEDVWLLAKRDINDRALAFDEQQIKSITVAAGNTLVRSAADGMLQNDEFGALATLIGVESVLSDDAAAHLADQSGATKQQIKFAFGKLKKTKNRKVRSAILAEIGIPAAVLPENITDAHAMRKFLKPSETNQLVNRFWQKVKQSSLLNRSFLQDRHKELKTKLRLEGDTAENRQSMNEVATLWAGSLDPDHTKVNKIAELSGNFYLGEIRKDLARLHPSTAEGRINNLGNETQAMMDQLREQFPQFAKFYDIPEFKTILDTNLKHAADQEYRMLRRELKDDGFAYTQKYYPEVASLWSRALRKQSFMQVHAGAMSEEDAAANITDIQTTMNKAIRMSKKIQQNLGHAPYEIRAIPKSYSKHIKGQIDAIENSVVMTSEDINKTGFLSKAANAGQTINSIIENLNQTFGGGVEGAMGLEQVVKDKAMKPEYLFVNSLPVHSQDRQQLLENLYFEAKPGKAISQTMKDSSGKSMAFVREKVRNSDPVRNMVKSWFSSTNVGTATQTIEGLVNAVSLEAARQIGKDNIQESNVADRVDQVVTELISANNTFQVGAGDAVFIPNRLIQEAGKAPGNIQLMVQIAKEKFLSDGPFHISGRFRKNIQDLNKTMKLPPPTEDQLQSIYVDQLRQLGNVSNFGTLGIIFKNGNFPVMRKAAPGKMPNVLVFKSFDDILNDPDLPSRIVNAEKKKRKIFSGGGDPTKPEEFFGKDAGLLPRDKPRQSLERK